MKDVYGNDAGMVDKLKEVEDSDVYYENATDELELILEERIPVKNSEYCEDVKKYSYYESIHEDSESLEL